MAKKKRTEEEILEDIRNYKPRMTKGEDRKTFYARMMGAIITDDKGNVIDDEGNIIDNKGKEDMIQTIPTPTRPHFIFSGKMWEIDNEFKLISGERLKTVITFEHIIKTGVIDDDLSFKGSMELPAGSAWTITEKVSVEIDSEFSDPIVTMWKENAGTMVDKKENMKEIEPFSLPMYHIKKLVREAVKLDAQNRPKLATY